MRRWSFFPTGPYGAYSRHWTPSRSIRAAISSASSPVHEVPVNQPLNIWTRNVSLAVSRSSQITKLYVVWFRSSSASKLPSSLTIRKAVGSELGQLMARRSCGLPLTGPADGGDGEGGSAGTGLPETDGCSGTRAANVKSLTSEDDSQGIWAPWVAVTTSARTRLNSCSTL